MKTIFNFNFNKEEIINILQQICYDIVFACACSSVAVCIVTLLTDLCVSWKPLWFAISGAVLLITCIYRIIIKYFFPQYMDSGEYEEEPVYAYHNYCNGYAAVEKVVYTDRGHKSNITKFSFVDKTGNFITERWYDGVSDFFEDGVAAVYDGETGKYNLINGHGIELMDEWVDNMEEFEDGVAKVYRKAYKVIQRSADGVMQMPEGYVEYIEVNFVTATGNLIWDKWREAL